jgi:hypothetical protein
MKVFRLPNRPKLANELTRRYEEAIRHAENGVSDDEEATQFISLLAHYIQYVKKNDLTKAATEELFVQKELMSSDEKLVKEAEEIIEQMKKDRAKLIRYAKSKNISTDNYQFKNAQMITGDIEFAYNLTHLNDDFLNLPDDQQYITELPRAISHLLSMNWVAQNQGGETKKLGEMRKYYLELQTTYEKKLKLQGVFMDYLRIEDYKALNTVWKEVYREGNEEDLFIFHFEYGHLFEKNRHYSGGQLTEAKDFVGRFITHLQRFHNYLIDSIEDVPRAEKFLLWTVQHFGPTLVSVIIIILLYIFLNWIGIKIDLDTIKSYT